MGNAKLLSHHSSSGTRVPQSFVSEADFEGILFVRKRCSALRLIRADHVIESAIAARSESQHY